VVASHGEIVANGIRIDATLDFAHATPENIRWISILLVAGNHAALAPDALGHIEMKAILFARAWRRWKRNASANATQRFHHPVGLIRHGGQTECVVARLDSFE
jgi:hypothetical protein